MTVCVGVTVNDCVVFAADSAATLISTDQQSGQSQILNVYQHGDKVFNLFKRLPVVAMTCGMGNIGSDSIGTLAKDLRRRMMGSDVPWKIDPDNYTIADIAGIARKFLFDDKFNSVIPPPAAPHSFEFWIGGYSSNFDADHEIWKISVVNGACTGPQLMQAPGKAGWFVGGQPTPVNRLVVGFDERLSDLLIKAGLDQKSAAQVQQFLRGELEVQMATATMPVRDAIDLADFLVETTKRFFRFLPGADIVGGDTDIAVVTKYEGFKWIRRKHFYPAELNPLETDHAR